MKLLKNIGLKAEVKQDTVESIDCEEARELIRQSTNAEAKAYIVEALADSDDTIVLLDEILSSHGITKLIANYLVEDEIVEKYVGLLHEHGYVPGKKVSEQTDEIANFIADKRVFFLVVKFVFSPKVMGTAKYVFYDDELKMRRAALNKLGNYPINDVEHIYIKALDDPNKKIRKQCFEVLKERVSGDRLVEIAEANAQDVNELYKILEKAKGTVEEMAGKIPYLRKIYSMLKKIGKIAFWSPVYEVVKNKDAISGYFKGLSRKSKGVLGKSTESPHSDIEAVFSLALLICWADGIIEENEREVLEGIAEDNSLPHSLLVYIDEKPKIENLAKYITPFEDHLVQFEELLDLLDVDVSENTAIPDLLKQLEGY